MSDQLNRIEKMLLEMKETLATKKELAALNEKVDKLPTREEFKSLGETTDLIAVGLEDKTEASHTILKSHFDYLYQEMQELKQHMDQRFDKMEAVILEGFKQTVDRFSQVSDKPLV
jgi:DNA anti-recombination protein RmuC